MEEASLRPPSTTLLIIRSWFFNRDAEEAGKRLGLPAALLCVFFAAMAAAFPFSLARYKEATSLADPARWPGLGTALMEAAARGGDFSVAGGTFHRDPAAPVESVASNWRVILDGGEVWTSAPEGRILRLGRTRFTLSVPETKSLLDAPLSALEGVRGGDLRALSGNRAAFTLFVKGFLSAAAAAEVPGAILATSLLMLLQTAIFVIVLGLFLSLSVLAVGWRGRGQGRVEAGTWRAGLDSSLRTTAALATGPGLAAALAGLLLPGAGPALAWIGFSLLLGLRVVILYMGRFKKGARAAVQPSPPA